MNEYKLAWLSEQAVSYGQVRSIAKLAPKKKTSGKSLKASDVMNVAAKQKAQGTVLSGGFSLAKHAAQSPMKGRVGMAVRLTGRIGMRAIPVVGAAMLAYDVYQFGSWLLEDD